MTEDATKDLTDGEKLDRILQRLAALEAQGANTTRPLLDQLIKEMTQTRDMLMERMDGLEREMRARLEGVEKELHSINRQFEVFSMIVRAKGSAGKCLLKSL